jgi:hypothetical protein
MRTTTVGIDPGASGALAFITETGGVVIHRVKDGDLHGALQDAISCSMGENLVAYLENVPTYIAAASKPTHAKLGRAFGYWEGLLAGRGVKTVLVRPQDWQRGLPNMTSKKGPDRKRALRDEAARRFPGVRVTLDNCDALLIAEWGQRQERGGAK